jgi:type II secretory pathway pseudopilin PulG
MTKNKVKDIKPGSLTVIGQSLLEVVVAVGISALILVAVASLAAGSVRTSSYNRNNAQATKYAQEALEWLRTQRDEDWDTFASYSSTSGVTTNLCTSPISAWGGTCPIANIFFRSTTLTMDASNSDIIDAVVSVTWTDSQGVHEVRSATKFTNWRR